MQDAVVVQLVSLSQKFLPSVPVYATDPGFEKNMADILALTQVSTKVSNNSQNLIRGRSQTTFTRFVFFLTTYPPPSVYIFYGIIVYKKSIFLSIYPPLLVNVVCERPLKENNVNLFDKVF